MRSRYLLESPILACPDGLCGAVPKITRDRAILAVSLRGPAIKDPAADLLRGAPLLFDLGVVTLAAGLAMSSYITSGPAAPWR